MKQRCNNAQENLWENYRYKMVGSGDVVLRERLVIYHASMGSINTCITQVVTTSSIRRCWAENTNKLLGDV